MDAFQRKQELAGKMQYCHTVTKIARAEPDAADGAKFILSLHVQDPCNKATGWDGIKNLDIGQQAAQTHRCGVMLMADGMWKPVNPLFVLFFFSGVCLIIAPSAHPLARYCFTVSRGSSMMTLYSIY